MDSMDNTRGLKFFVENVIITRRKQTNDPFGIVHFQIQGYNANVEWRKMGARFRARG
jgi:hypothetical protein